MDPQSSTWCNPKWQKQGGSTTSQWPSLTEPSRSCPEKVPIDGVGKVVARMWARLHEHEEVAVASQIGGVVREGATVSAVNRPSWASVMTSLQHTSNVHCIPVMSTPSQNPSGGAFRVMSTFSKVDASLIVAFLAVSSRQRAAGECHCSTRPIKQVTFKYHIIHELPFGTAGSVVQFNRVATGLKQIAAHILGLPAVNHFGD